jgi:hypothetical protein
MNTQIRRIRGRKEENIERDVKWLFLRLLHGYQYLMNSEDIKDYTTDYINDRLKATSRLLGIRLKPTQYFIPSFVISKAILA